MRRDRSNGLKSCAARRLVNQKSLEKRELKLGLARIAHTLGREVILITQCEHDIPFDLRHLRYVPYLNNAEGRDALTEALQSRMQTIMGH